LNSKQKKFLDWSHTQFHESDIGPDRIIITPHLIIIHSISTMGCNFTQLLDSIRSDCKIRLSNLIIWVSSIQIFVPIWLERLWISVCVKQYPLLCCGSRSLIKRKHWYQSFDVFTKHPSIDWIVEWVGRRIINRWILN